MFCDIWVKDEFGADILAFITKGMLSLRNEMVKNLWESRNENNTCILRYQL